MTLDLDNLMRFATDTAAEAGRITLTHFGSVQVEFKGDGSEVTAADRASEAYILAAIGERFPDHGVFGEEGASVESRSRYRWIIDPIDGTRSFASGVPLYGVLLALEKDGRPILGCCHFPALSDTIVAADGAGCWRGEARVSVSSCDTIADARIVTSGLEYWRDWATEPAKEGFQRLIARGRFGRTWGDCFGYVLVATGRAEILADPACGAYWDYAPMVPIITEAGGRFTTLGGRPVGTWTSALATNGILHEDASRCWGTAPLDEVIQLPPILARHES
jgi:histidinol-phosphatase